MIAHGFFLIFALLRVHAQDYSIDKPNILDLVKSDNIAPKGVVCYDTVGCFDNNPPFNNAANLLPIPPDVLKTKFRLYKNLIESDVDNLSYLNENSVRFSKYNKNHPLKIVIHGFQNTGETPWVIQMARNILIAERGNVNVITVDWGIGAVFPAYLNATANTRLVGRQTCLLVKLIRKVFYDDVWSNDFNIHCIGHSLGAHTCGYASTECGSIFNRISALDPAGPLFENFDIKVRIDPSDANFVDVIHSNGDTILSGSFGMQKPCGHVDFYPNGGIQQPGCPTLVTSIITLINDASAAISGISCSHGRAINYFIESIYLPCVYLSYPCYDAFSFDEGNCFDCSEGCTYMGYHVSSSSRGIKYLATRSTEQFCGNQYLLEVYTSFIEKRTAGEILLFFESAFKTTIVRLTNLGEDIVPYKRYRKIFVTDVDLAFVDRAYIQFNRNNILTNNYEIYINKIKIIHGEVKKEIYSFCNLGLKINDREKKEIKLYFSDCQFSYQNSIFNFNKINRNYYNKIN